MASVTSRQLPGEWSATGWRPPARHLEFEQWERIGAELRDDQFTMERDLSTVLWQRADWLNYGEGMYQERHAQALEEWDYAPGSLNNIARVGAHFPHSRRRDPAKVTFWKHAEVMGLDEPTEDALLQRCEEEGLTFKQLRAEVAEIKRKRKQQDEDGQDQLPGTENAGKSDQPTCPLCHGAGTVTADQEEAYLREEGVVGR